MSEAEGWKPDLTQGVEGKGHGDAGTRGGMTSSKPRQRGCKKEMEGAMPSSETRCFRYFSEIEGHGSADLVIPVL